MGYRQSNLTEKYEKKMIKGQKKRPAKMKDENLQGKSVKYERVKQHVGSS